MKILVLLALAAPAQELLTPLEDITISAPAVKVPAIDPQIHSHLLRLLQQRMDARPDSLATLDASIGNLNKITTVTGYRLKTRYTELGFLLTEGLAGVKDMQLVSELERVVRQGSNVQTRAAAMVALAYTRDQRHISLFQGALNDQSVTVRLAAVESLTLLGTPAVQLIIGNAARTDLSPIVQAYAAEQMWRMGDIFGRELLLRLGENPDWFVRAMAVRPLGELGGANEYRRMQLWLTRESHPSVKVELLSAMMRLRKLVEKGG
jgi:HEAT repeat protein